MKVCTQCKIEKEGYEFPKRKTNKDGLYSWCKECCNAKTKANALANPEKVKASREKRKDAALAVAREYKKKHKVRLDKQRKIHYLLNREEICRKAREYSKNPTEEQRQRKSKYYYHWKTTNAAKEYRDRTYEYRKVKYAKYKKSSQMVADAIDSGKLIKASNCTLCLSSENIEGHHPDYDKPLEVIWLCRKCHKNLHKELRERKGTK